MSSLTATRPRLRRLDIRARVGCGSLTADSDGPLISSMMLDQIFERFATKSPITVMAHLGLERVLEPSWLDEVFQEYRERQYERELLFSTVVEVVALVALGMQPSVHAAPPQSFRTRRPWMAGRTVQHFGVEPGARSSLNVFARDKEVESFPPAGRNRFAVLVLALFALGLVLRLPTFFRPLLSDDEAIYATTADALARGDLLYRDVVDHKPPLIYHVYQAGFALLGPYNTHGAHALVVLSVMLTAAFLLATARRERGPIAGLAAAGLFLIFSTTWHDYDALAANCELFVLAPQAMAAWLLLRNLLQPTSKTRDFAVHFGVGILIGLSALGKYQGLTFLGVSIGMLAWFVFLGRLRWSWAAALAVLHLAGSLLPAAVYLVGCALAGNLDATLYWFRFNFAYVGAGLGGTTALARGLLRTVMIGGVALVPYALGGAGAVATAAALARPIVWQIRRSSPAKPGLPSATSLLALLWLCTSAFAVCAGGRFFGHYFHLILPPLCLLAAPRLLGLWRRGLGFRFPLALLCGLPPLVFFALASFARPLALALDESEPDYQAVAARMSALTAPEEPVFVWGNSPQLYVLAQRPMGARFSFCNYMTGESPGTPTETGQWNADANQLPAAWDMLFADLETRRPALFVDASAAGWDGYDKFPVARYPRLATYLGQHYRPVETRRGVMIYRRIR